MLRLNLAREPYWLDLGRGVRVQVEPLTTALMVAARSDPEVRDLPEETSVRASFKIRTIVAKMVGPDSGLSLSRMLRVRFLAQGRRRRHPVAMTWMSLPSRHHAAGSLRRRRCGT